MHSLRVIICLQVCKVCLCLLHSRSACSIAVESMTKITRISFNCKRMSKCRRSRGPCMACEGPQMCDEPRMD